MAKPRKKQGKLCSGTIRLVGNHLNVTAKCPTSNRIKTSKKATKVTSKKVTKVKSKKSIKRTEVPVACKGLKKIKRKECAKRVCAQRPKEYRKDCLRKAGIR